MPGTSNRNDTPIVKIIPKKQDENAYLAHTAPDVLKSITNTYLSTNDCAKLSRTCTFFYNSLQPDIHKAAMKALQEAVLDGDIPSIQKILNSNSKLLWEQPTQSNKIQSELTWKRIIGEVPFVMALKTRQVDVIEAMLPYLKTSEDKEKALTLWENVRQKPAKTYDFKLLITVFAQEDFPNGVTGALSEKTQEALELFRDAVLPKEAIALDDDYDVLEHLIACLKAYEEHFKQFKNWDQCGAYCVFVYGFLQSLVPREYAAIFCHGLYAVVENKEKVGNKAGDPKLDGGEAFFRGRASSEGLGFNYFCAAYAHNGYGQHLLCIRATRDLLENLSAQKQRSLTCLKNSLCEEFALNQPPRNQ